MTTPSGMPVTWEVTGISSDTRLDQQNNPVAGYEVMYKLSSGPMASVFLPGMTFDPAVARDMLAKHAATLHAINTLSGQV